MRIRDSSTELFPEFIFVGADQFFDELPAFLPFYEIFETDGVGFVVKREIEFKNPGNSGHSGGGVCIIVLKKSLLRGVGCVPGVVPVDAGAVHDIGVVHLPRGMCANKKSSKTCVIELFCERETGFEPATLTLAR